MGQAYKKDPAEGNDEIGGRATVGNIWLQNRNIVKREHGQVERVRIRDRVHSRRVPQGFAQPAGFASGSVEEMKRVTVLLTKRVT